MAYVKHAGDQSTSLLPTNLALRLGNRCPGPQYLVCLRVVAMRSILGAAMCRSMRDKRILVASIVPSFGR